MSSSTEAIPGSGNFGLSHIKDRRELGSPRDLTNHMIIESFPASCEASNRDRGDRSDRNFAGSA
jgi:hypothetical protein